MHPICTEGASAKCSQGWDWAWWHIASISPAPPACPALQGRVAVRAGEDTGRCLLAEDKGSPGPLVLVGLLKATRVTLWASACQGVFTEVVGHKRPRPEPSQGAKRRRKEARQRDQEFYVPYRPKDFDSERG